MSRDDYKDESIPEPQAPATEAEQARAASFGKLVDGMLEGSAAPPALEADERELLVVATAVHAANTDVDLDEGRRDLLIDRAFAQALELAAPATKTTPREQTGGGASSGGTVVSLAERRTMLRRSIPWGIAVVATAAAVFLAFARTPQQQTTVKTVVVERPVLSVAHTSRPADALVGKIDPKDAARASDRIDMIVADRMSGYRDLYLRGLTRTPSQPRHLPAKGGEK